LHPQTVSFFRLHLLLAVMEWREEQQGGALLLLCWLPLPLCALANCCPRTTSVNVLGGHGADNGSSSSVMSPMRGLSALEMKRDASSS
jgi:hypothetical protein